MGVSLSDEESRRLVEENKRLKDENIRLRQCIQQHHTRGKPGKLATKKSTPLSRKTKPSSMNTKAHISSSSTSSIAPLASSSMPKLSPQPEEKQFHLPQLTTFQGKQQIEHPVGQDVKQEEVNDEDQNSTQGKSISEEDMHKTMMEMASRLQGAMQEEGKMKPVKKKKDKNPTSRKWEVKPPLQDIENLRLRMQRANKEEDFQNINKMLAAREMIEQENQQQQLQHIDRVREEREMLLQQLSMIQQNKVNATPQDPNSQDINTTTTSSSSSPAGNQQEIPNVPVPLVYSKKDIHQEIEMYSFRFGQWEKVQILDFDKNRNMHKCLFAVDHNVKWLDLRKKQIRK